MNQKDFCILHPSGVEISSKLVESDISSIGGVKSRDLQTGWVWYDLPSATIHDKNIIFSIAFFNGKLNNIDIALDDPELYGASWSDWDENKEKLRAKNTGEWLGAIGYKLGSYSWGRIQTFYDSKGGCGYASVRYNL